jgi:hypothetical protein
MVVKGGEDCASKSFFSRLPGKTLLGTVGYWDGRVLMFQAIIPGVVIHKIFSKTKA